MHKKTKVLIIVILVGLMLLTACNGNAQMASPTLQVIPTENQAVAPDFSDPKTGFGVEVEGRILPSKHVNLAFKASGQVAEVLVEEGDITYTVLIRLDEGDQNLRWGMTALVTFIE